MDCWTLDQAHCLLIGLDWNVIQLLAKNAGWDSPISVPDFSDNFRQLLCGARDKKVLIFPAAPDDVIRWAACKKLNLPELLLDYAATLDKAAPVIDAPVAAEGASGGMPDPERRLARLRALGGTAKYVRHEWKFTGMADLVESEKTDDRKRCSEKTIRADLIQAAQAERDEKSPGFGAGLGRR